ncbi:retron St85 family RNA-directed DNA polymerase [Chitinophaga pendula]|uniref:reverse transcriptase domain-containing protein n=1 Tax=Chitinophaga TaxID=79328 RepID=UPI000BAE8435|nr:MULTISPECIES: reverse transcriptase domain-containing protein [Chitinophaga]ASZ12330.1 RNA-dependent DNA polymerase [Chitinophaga sp. MD30]UCJ10076.1 retron St85 family RNA-directed DNA polymerase [Chitinophaga pendula]
MAEGLTRQQLYDRIRSSSKEEYILNEMVRLGFWAHQTATPTLPESILNRERELRKELGDLLAEKQKYRDKERLLAEMRKQRMEAAKQKRAATKQRREEERQSRAAAWTLQKAHSVVYLGEDVSAGLNKAVSDTVQLAKYGLPLFHNGEALATAMGVSLGTLRFLAFNRNVGYISHYKRFKLPKKSGGHRTISAPMPQLKAAQHWILEHILYKVPHSPAAHGFVPERSIVTNAAPHVGQDIVINIDLKDFFPSIAYKRVKGLFCKLGYSEQVATILGLLCTEPEVDEVSLDNRTYYVAKTARHLPQGAPTSPAITNLICFKLDRRFEGLAARLGYTYTRYADDMTFSTKGAAAEKPGQLIWSVKQVVKEEGFTIHPDKLKVMRKGDQRAVTGIVVNEQLSLDRATLRKFRALLHQISQTGLANKSWGKGNIISSMEGYANYVAMVKPALGAQFKQTLANLLARDDIKQAARAMWTGTPVSPVPIPAPTPTASPAKEETPPPAGDKPWWDVL